MITSTIKDYLCVLIGLVLTAMPAIVSADLIQQSTTYARTVLMTSSSDHITGATGLTLTVTESRAGSAFGASAATITEIGNGWYKIALATTDTSTLGAFNLHVTASGADPSDTADQVVAFNPNDSSLLGLTGVGTLVNQTTLLTNVATANTGLTSANTSLGTLTTRIPNTLLFDGSGYLKSSVWAYNTGMSPASQVLKTASNPIAADISGLVTFNNSTIGSVTGNITVGGFAGGLVPSNFASLAIDGTGRVTYNNSISDPFAVAVPGTYAVGTFGYLVGNNLNAPISSRLASNAVPANFSSLNINASNGGVLVNGYATGQDPATLVLSGVIDGGITLKQAQELSLSVLNGKYSVSRNTTAKTLTTVYYRQDGATVLATSVVTYSDAALTQIVNRTVTFTNL